MITPTLLSVCIGQLQTVPYRGKPMRTGIFKTPVEGPVKVTRLGLEGDHQADPRYHGGPNKAVYLYPSEHYAFWKQQYPEMQLPYGMFGENLTTSGLLEADLPKGAILSIGSAEFRITDPRSPCLKLGMKFGRKDVIARFEESGRTGLYLAVTREGTVAAGDCIEVAQS